MPLYDFSCPACAHVQEELRKQSDVSRVLCSECNNEMTKVLSMPAVLKPYGEEGQARKAIDAIIKKDKQTKLYNK